MFLPVGISHITSPSYRRTEKCSKVHEYFLSSSILSNILRKLKLFLFGRRKSKIQCVAKQNKKIVLFPKNLEGFIDKWILDIQ